MNPIQTPSIVTIACDNMNISLPNSCNIMVLVEIGSSQFSSVFPTDFHCSLCQLINLYSYCISMGLQISNKNIKYRTFTDILNTRVLKFLCLVLYSRETLRMIRIVSILPNDRSLTSRYCIRELNYKYSSNKSIWITANSMFVYYSARGHDRTKHIASVFYRLQQKWFRKGDDNLKSSNQMVSRKEGVFPRNLKHSRREL
jgi:hypothetical protein